MFIGRSLLVLLCIVTVMSFRTITRSPLKAFHVPLRMMSDQQETRTYVGYTLYKSKSALKVQPVPATLKIENGYRTVAREGTLLFEFAPGANKNYDWSNKVLFALSATECGELVRIKDSDTVSFVHSPNAMSGDTSITKKLSVTPVADGKGVFVSVSQNDKTKTPPATTNLSVMLTWAELEVIRTIARYSIPRFIGIDLVV